MNDVSASHVPAAGHPELFVDTTKVSKGSNIVAACAQKALQHSPQHSPAGSLASLDSGLASLESLLNSPAAAQQKGTSNPI